MGSAAENFSERPPFSWARVLTVVLPALLVVGAVYAVTWREFNRESREKESKQRRQLGLESDTTIAPLRLDDKYTDADGDLVADTPQDAAKQISPDTLLFAFIAGPDAEQDRENWKEFLAFLSQRTGKHVNMLTFETTEKQLEALRDGKLHVAGFNTGAVPLAVNTAGFVPICARGGDDGKFSDSMQVIVPADSEIRNNHPEDLRGHTVVFVDRTSNSGYKAAVVLLREHHLEPLRDYGLRFSGAHPISIKSIGQGSYEVAPVSREMLNREIARGEVNAAQFRVIYESERFPPATLGYAYNLAPDLAGKVKAAFLEFSWNGTGLERQFTGSGATKFVPVSYKNDFALIRRNNDAVRDPPDIVDKSDQQPTESGG